MKRKKTISQLLFVINPMILVVPTSTAHSAPPSIHLPFHHLASKHIMIKKPKGSKEQNNSNSACSITSFPYERNSKAGPTARQRETARLPRAPPFAEIHPPSWRIFVLYGCCAHGSEKIRRTAQLMPDTSLLKSLGAVLRHPRTDESALYFLIRALTVE